MASFYKGTIPVLDDSAHPDMTNPPAVGFGYVPRDYSVYPETMFAQPTEMQLIPESEWDARFDEQEATKSSLEHLYLGLDGNSPKFVNLDQNGQGFCHTADTEVLTERGWKAWPDYNWTDLLATVNPASHVMEFQSPFQRHVYQYEGEMIHSTNRRLDFGVTPDHRMMVRKWDEAKRTLSREFTFQRAGSLGWYCGLLDAPAGFMGTEFRKIGVPGDRVYDGDDFLALLALVVSDGFAGCSEKTMNLVSFACFREDMRPEVVMLATRLGFQEQPSRRGVWNRWNAGALAEWIRGNCYTGGGFNAQCKRIPDFVKSCSVRQIHHFLAWNGDQNHDREVNGECYYSSSKRMIDDLQELCLRVGKRGTISHRGPRTGTMPQGTISTAKECWAMNVSFSGRLCLDKKKHIEQDKYKGEVYCAAVPNGTLVTRRNGSVLISGNCWAYSTGTALMMTRLAMGLPLVRLSPHAVACKIKNFRDEGGWCGLSAEFSRNTGYPSEQFWPAQSMSRQYDKPETWANAELHKATEDWVDLTKKVYDQNLTRSQVATCGFNNIPVPSDFHWWSHSVCQIRWVRIEAGSWGPLILNSWKGWGRHGLAVLQGSKAICNGAVAIRSTGISPV